MCRLHENFSSKSHHFGNMLIETIGFSLTAWKGSIHFVASFRHKLYQSLSPNICHLCIYIQNILLLPYAILVVPFIIKFFDQSLFRFGIF